MGFKVLEVDCQCQWLLGCVYAIPVRRELRVLGMFASTSSYYAPYATGSQAPSRTRHPAAVASASSAPSRWVPGQAALPQAARRAPDRWPPSRRAQLLRSAQLAPAPRSGAERPALARACSVGQRTVARTRPRLRLPGKPSSECDGETGDTPARAAYKTQLRGGPRTGSRCVSFGLTTGRG